MAETTGRPRLGPWRLGVPPLVAVLLFVVAFFWLLLPAFERALMASKRDLSREVTAVAWNLVDHYRHQAESGELSVTEAQRRALAALRGIRYGPENKDYIWVTDMTPRMVMHPYLRDLEGQDLSDYTDPDDKRFFADYTEAVAESGHADVTYRWQWKDDPTRIVPKLSHVRAYEPWGWVIGSGLYIDDVEAEIAAITTRLWQIAGVISAAVAALMAVSALQGFRAERGRRQAEEALRQSRERYRALVEANDEGLMLVDGGRVITANRSLCGLLGYAEGSLRGRTVETIIGSTGPGSELLSDVLADGRLRQVETDLVHVEDRSVPALLVASRIHLAGQPAVAVTVRDLRNARATDRDALPLPTVRTTASFPPRIIACNAAARRVLGFEAGSGPVGQGARLLFADRREFFHLSRRLAREEPCEDIRMHVRRVDGTVMPVRAWLVVEGQREREVVLHWCPDTERESLQREIVELRSLHSMDSRPPGAPSFGTTRAREAAVTDAAAALETGAPPAAITRHISAQADEMLTAIIADELRCRGPAPIDFTWCVLGSQARSEQGLHTDQDNCLIYADQATAADRRWFLAFAEAVNTRFAEAGYPLCPGEAMARNPQWCQSLAAWRRTFDAWICATEPQDLITIGIFFDFRPIAGDATLAETLREHILNRARGRDVFFLQLAQEVLHYRLPLSLFGGIKGSEEEGKRIDLKEIMAHMVAFARIYALRNGIAAIATIDRLQALSDAGILSLESHEEIRQAWLRLLDLRLRRQMWCLRHATPIDNSIAPDDLNGIDTVVLKRILNLIGELQNRLRRDFVRVA